MISLSYYIYRLLYYRVLNFGGKNNGGDGCVMYKATGSRNPSVIVELIINMIVFIS